MEKRTYTSDEVHQIVDMVLHTMDYPTTPEESGAHLDNSIPLKTSPSGTKVALTVREAAEEIGISKPKMYELVRSGKFNTVQIGKNTLISRQSLMDWIRKGDSYGKKAC